MIFGTDKIYYFNNPSILEFYLKHKDNFYRITNKFEKIDDETKIKHLQMPHIVCEINGSNGDKCHFEDTPLYNFSEIAKRVFENKGYSYADILEMENAYSDILL